jgi:hypothetical protein
MRYRLKQIIQSILGVSLALLTVVPQRRLPESTSDIIEIMVVKLVFLFLTMACFRAASDSGQKARHPADSG